ncbi:hypothetical protein [Candidatus Poriferisodalis sp.]|uniref:hypothetical protein n=1 Tax=Candidatus Poriferisodalis sp. TaxID=3101277 RepID=UPI003B01083B
MAFISQPFMSQLSDLWRRRPNAVHWTAVGAVAFVALVLVAGATGNARSAAEAWGTSVRVLAAQRPLAIGSSAQEHVDLIDVPAHLVPAGALTSTVGLGELTRAVPAGAMLSELDFNPASGVSPGRRGIGISVVQHAPDVKPGTPVELMLFADIDPFEPSAGHQSAERVPAHVLEASREGWFVEIEPTHLDAVARASATGVVVPIVLSADR